MKELHQSEIKEMKKELEKTAIVHLNESSRKALEENTLLLRNV
jgi:hypothetical protein